MVVTKGSTAAGSGDSLNLQRGGWDLGCGQPLSHCVEATQPLTGQPWSWVMATTPALGDKERKSPLGQAGQGSAHKGLGCTFPPQVHKGLTSRAQCFQTLRQSNKMRPRPLIASRVWEVAGLPIHPPRAALARYRAKGLTLEVDGLGLTLVLLIFPTGK